MSQSSQHQARVYATALFNAAGTAAPTVLDELQALVTLKQESPESWDQLLSPQLTTAQRKAALLKLYDKATATSRNFLQLLVDKHRLHELPEIVERFTALVKQHEQLLDVRITTAVALPDELQQRLEQRLSESTGQTVRLHPSVDPEIIGGLVVQHGDTLIDSSIRSRLEQIRLQLRRTAR